MSCSDRPEIELFDLTVGPEEGHYRFCVGGKHYKYVTINTDVYSSRTMCEAVSLIPSLPPFPEGDWNMGLIARDTSGSPYFKSVSRRELPTISTWHCQVIDFSDLDLTEDVRFKVFEATVKSTGAPVIVKYARFPWETQDLAAETRAYEWIEGTDIGPKFLGHVVEEDRPMGIVLQNIEGARHAGPDDLAGCREVLSRLHALGVKHGDINRHNFLVVDRRVVLLDFEASERCSDAAALEAEMNSLPAALQDTSGVGWWFDEG